MSATEARKKNQRLSLILLGVLVVAIIGLVAWGYLADRNNYEKGHQAYVQADCGTAISHFEKVINKSRLFDIGQYAQRAQVEKAECDVFQQAVQFETGGDLSLALVGYLDFMKANANSQLVGAARTRVTGLFQAERIPLLASEASCTRAGELIANSLIPDQETNLPVFYLGCGQMYEQINQPTFALAMYQWILMSYPNDPAAVTAETSLLAMPLACEESETLKQSAIANRTDFMPRLYHGCGLLYEESLDHANARKMYEAFLANYPDHTLAQEVEASLARTIVAQAAASGAGKIEQPESSGFTSSGVVQIIIQNDSPDRLRITFSGPTSQVEQLDACSTCTSYEVGQVPLYCPAVGPMGQYTLPPGTYDIVVESISDSRVTPWAGHWDLVDGNEYYRCFLLTASQQ